MQATHCKNPVIRQPPLLMVGRVVAHPTATSKPRPVGTRPVSHGCPLGAAPQNQSHCQRHIHHRMAGDEYLTPAPAPAGHCIRSSVRSRPPLLPKTLAFVAPVSSLIPSSRQPILWLSQRHSLLEESLSSIAYGWLPTQGSRLRAVNGSGASWARSVCRFDVTLEGHSYAGFLVE